MNFQQNGFAEVFSHCESLPNVSHGMFRSDPKFAFVCPVGDHITTPDIEAIQIGIKWDRELFSKYLSVDKPYLGYENLSYAPLDTIDCRHMMMSTIAFSHSIFKNVVEIGGGYGNWAYLNLEVHKQIDNWTIIDLPFVLELQRWYLFRSLEPTLNKKVEFVPNDKVKEMHPDLLIGAHSLSELSWVDFMYYRDIMLNSQYMFYAFHVSWPHPELIERKKQFILDHFKVVHEVNHLDGTAKNWLLQRR